MAKVEDLIASLNKTHKANIASMGLEYENPPRLSTGWFELDLQIGGGVPEGKVTMIYGSEASMKTTISLLLIAEAQRKYPDKKAVFIDVEGHLDRNWAEIVGVNVKDLVFVLPDNSEQTIDVLEGLLHAEDVSIIVLDSVAAMVTQGELESSAEKAVVGNAGLAANKMYRKVSHALRLSKRDGDYIPTLILINQIRSKVGVMFGSPETTPGGPSAKFLASLILRLYGKDEMEDKVSKRLPAYKKVSVILKKWKVPVVNAKGEVHVCLIDNSFTGLKVGESTYLKPVMFHLERLGLWQKSGSKYQLFSSYTGEIVEEFDTVKQWRQKMVDDLTYRRKIKDMVMNAVLSEEAIDPV